MRNTWNSVGRVTKKGSCWFKPLVPSHITSTKEIKDQFLRKKPSTTFIRVTKKLLTSKGVCFFIFLIRERGVGIVGSQSIDRWQNLFFFSLLSQSKTVWRTRAFSFLLSKSQIVSTNLLVHTTYWALTTWWYYHTDISLKQNQEITNPKYLTEF